MSADNRQKTPLARTLESFGNRKVRSALKQLGQCLPATVVSVASPGTVIVQFAVQSNTFTLDNIEVPIIGSQWVRIPIQIGTPGFVTTADAYLGGMSGIGGGVADLTPRGNLGMLVWTPIGNRTWPPSSNPTAVDINGPGGVILRDVNSASRLVITPISWDAYPPSGQPVTVHGDLMVTGNVITAGNFELGGVIQGAAGLPYAGEISTSGAVIAGKGTGDQVGLSTHNHEYDKPSSGGTTPTATTSPNAGT